MVRPLAAHQCVPSSILHVTCGLRLLVLYPSPRGFSPSAPASPFRLPPMCPEFDSARHMWAALAGSLPFSEGFFSECSSFPVSPPTNVSRVRFPDCTSHVGRVCWFFSLLRGVLLRVLRFLRILKKTVFNLILFDLCSVPI